MEPRCAKILKMPHLSLSEIYPSISVAYIGDIGFPLVGEFEIVPKKIQKYVDGHSTANKVYDRTKRVKGNSCQI